MAAVAIGGDRAQVFAASDVFRRHLYLDRLGGKVIRCAEAEIRKTAAKGSHNSQGT